MDRRLGFVALGGVAGVTVFAVVRRYRRDVADAYRRVEAVDRCTFSTESGVMEYSQRGSGPVLLVSHGIFHGCDGGLLAVRDVVVGRHVVVPSRFGYLGSTLPADASSVTQADAFVDVLDHLNLDTVDVMGISAGTGAALQLVLRHPGRVRHLVVSSGNLPGSPTAIAPPGWAKVFYNDPAMWILRRLSRSMIHRLMGVPAGFPKNTEQADTIDELVESIFPLRPRRAGAVFDAFVANPEVDTMPLESIRVPTMIIHARDDPLASYEAAARAAERIPGAMLVSLDAGGHLGLGKTERVRSEIATFLATPAGRSASA